MDNRTTIKVSKETKAEFDKFHKRMQRKNHDSTLELATKLAGFYLDDALEPSNDEDIVIGAARRIREKLIDVVSDPKELEACIDLIVCKRLKDRRG